ncbi:MAG: hypothetical protein M1816_004112 [Peltula sp. TS41687]|nr:MAG: hypothetical protein M1816_004112 [Peltula sp. TS41687]
MIMKMIRDFFLSNPAAVLLDEIPGSTERAARMMKLDYFNVICFPIEIGNLIKLAFLAFNYHFFPPGRYHIALYVMAGLITTIAIGFSLGSIFYCTPTNGFWDVTIDARCIEDSILYILHIAINVLTDLIVLLLPLPSVVKLRISKRKKWGLGILFALGGVASTATVVQLSNVTNWSRFTVEHVAWYRPFRAIQAWTQVEINLGIICTNAPSLAGLWRVLWRKNRSAASSSSPNFDFQMARREGGTPTTIGGGPSAGKRQMNFQKNEIIQSTHIVVDYEHPQ